MLEARQLGSADVEKAECIEGEEGALHALTGLIQFQGHEVCDLVRRVGHVSSDRGNRAHQVSDDIG
jgi:hypothetical protein